VSLVMYKKEEEVDNLED